MVYLINHVIAETVTTRWMIHSGTDSPQAEVLLVLKISINLDQSRSSDKQPSIFLSA